MEAGACAVVNCVLGIILSELKTQALKLSKNLKIDVRFIRQASARQGLKIEKPDEFDAIVPFTFNGLDLQEVRLNDIDGTFLPGQMRMRVLNQSVLDERFPKLQEQGVFQMDEGTCLINTKMLQEKVFKSLMDKTLSITEDSLRRRGTVLHVGRDRQP